jgi:hypothetical protein
MPFPFVNLLRGVTWITGGPGTVTVTAGTGGITIVTDGTGVAFARYGVPTTVNKRYQLTWSNDTSTVMFRMVGTTQGGSDVVGYNASTTGDNKLEFTATSTTTWISFQRPTAATVRISSIIMQEIPENVASARRLNGLNQYFSLDAQAAGLRISNANWYVGGWIAFTYLPTAPVYIADFGRVDPSGTGGGAGRVRMFWDPDQTKLAVSTAETTGSTYRENYIVTTIEPDTWYYVGMIAWANADAQVVLGTVRGSSYIGTAIPPVSASEVCRVLQIGARVVNPRTSFAPVRYSNWLWTSNWVPNASQMTELAAAVPPEDITGFTPPAGTAMYHWPMVVASGNEPSIRDTAPLVSNSTYGSPITVFGPPLPGSETAVVSPLDIIIA